MSLYIQKTKTTHSHFGRNEWFRACWEFTQTPVTQKISVATRFYESLIVLHHSWVSDEMIDEIVTLLTLDFEGEYVYIPKAKLNKKVVAAQRLFALKALHICLCTGAFSVKQAGTLKR